MATGKRRKVGSEENSQRSYLEISTHSKRTDRSDKWHQFKIFDAGYSAATLVL